LAPFVEHRGQELPPGARPHRERRDAGALAARGAFEIESGLRVVGAGQPLDHRGELDIFDSLRLQPAIDRLRLARGIAIDAGERVDRRAVPLQPFQRGHDQMVRGRAGAIAAMVVVNLGRPVEAEADEEPVFAQEARPVLVDQRAVGLECVLDRPAAAVALLQFERALVEGNAEQRRLAALPGEQYRLPGRRGGDRLAHIGFEYRVRHAPGGAGVV